MRLSSQHQRDLERGASIGGGAGLPVLAALYGLYAPTSDIRARIPFLLETSGGLLTVVVLFGFLVVGTMVLLGTRTFTRWALAGVVITSFAYATLLASGIIGRWLPQFESVSAQWGLLASSLVLGGVVIVRAASSLDTTPHSNERRERRVAFLGEQDGPPERELIGGPRTRLHLRDVALLEHAPHGTKVKTMKAPLILPISPDFATRWAAWYGATPPIGFLLREEYPDRWLRIHSLRSAARYPRSGWDYAELIRRHNTIANHVLGPGAESAFIVFCECSGGPPASSTWGGSVEDNSGL